jgi:hypothetical protein
MRRADNKLYPMKMGEAAKRGDGRDDARQNLFYHIDLYIFFITKRVRSGSPAMIMGSTPRRVSMMFRPLSKPSTQTPTSKVIP